MSDEFSQRKVEQSWEPGTLESTRRNIGPIDKDEALRMTQVLGGEIKQEKSAPIDYSAFPARERHYAHRATGRSSKDISSMNSENSEFSNESSSLNSENSQNLSEKKNQKYGYAPVNARKQASSDGLPEISSKEKALMDKMMMSDDFKLKTNYGIFNFVRHFKKNGLELLKPSFIEYSLKNHLEHYQAFLTTIKTIIQISPDSYKAKIVNSPETKFRFLRTTGNWTMKNLRILAMDLQQHSDEVTVAMMVPFVKLIYTDLLKIYYLGENAIPKLLKEIYADLIKYPKSDQNKILMLSKQALTEWLYLYTQIIKGLYPLLMRMCSPKFEYFPAFFTSQTANIFSFLGISKFDLILPQKKEEKIAVKKAEDEKSKKEILQKNEDLRGKKTEIVETGLKLLDKLFPEAGFLNLEKKPDMFPYFQPIFEFRDGYNLLSPQNPLQITITLLRISEDLFQGCRNIIFSDEVMPQNSKNPDKFSTALNEWSVYREDLFERQYGDQLRDFVNQEYSQGDFRNSLFGKKMLTTMLWMTKYYFLPHFQFEQLLLEKPSNDSKYISLYLRTDFLRKMFTIFARNIDEAQAKKGTVLGISNPWDRYEFDIPNAISRRLDVLLGAKKSDSETAATNANLIKYALCIVSVLDWWINNSESPAYSFDSKQIYRISENDGAPVFSVPLRTDQNKLFAANFKPVKK